MTEPQSHTSHRTHRPAAPTAGREADRSRRWRRALGLGAFTGAATLIPLWRMPRGPLLGWTGGVVAVGAAAGTALAMDRRRREAEVEGTAEPSGTPLRRLAVPVAVGAAAGAAATAGMWINTVTDRWAEQGIARLGIGRPRLVYAALAAVFTVAVESREDPDRDRSAPAPAKA